MTDTNEMAPLVDAGMGPLRRGILFRNRQLSVAALFCLAVLALGLAAACGGDDDDGTAATKRGTVKIGSVASQAGNFVLYGETALDGVELAVDEINAAGGVLVGDTVYTLDLENENTFSDVNTAAAATRKLVDNDDVQFLFGPLQDFHARVAQDVTQTEEVIMIAPSILLDEFLTAESVAPGGESHWLFRSLLAEDARQAISARAVVELLPEARTSQLLIADDQAGQFIDPAWEAAMTAAGHEVFDTIRYPVGTTDYGAFLTRIKNREPDILHVWHNPRDAVNVLRTAIELEAAPAYVVYGVDPAEFAELFDDPLDVPVILECKTRCWGIPSSERAADYWARFDAGGGDLNFAAGISLFFYDYVYMLTEAWQQAGTVTDTDAIVAALESLTYDGVLGSLSFDDLHMSVHGFDICLAENGDIDCAFREASS